MKLYTRTGDDGTTGLFGGARVSKVHPRIEAYGTVDEVNACVGMAAVTVTDDRLKDLLHALQSLLFDVGADLATPTDSRYADKIRRIAEADVSQMEKWIDECEEATPPIETFILPGGTETAARLHMARTVARRAERALLLMMEEEKIDAVILQWINRLSDLLFAAARYANHSAGVPDVPWKPAEH